MRVLRLRRRLVALTLAGMSVGVLLLHIMQAQLDTSQIPFAVPTREHYHIAVDDFAELPDDILGRIRRVSSTTTTTAHNSTTKTNGARSYQFMNKTNTDTPSLWPVPFNNRDRILDQLNYRLDPSAKRKPKVIFTHNENFYSMERFMKDKCPVQNCVFVHQHFQRKTADVIVFKGFSHATQWPRKTGQIWVSYLLEAPPNGFIFSPLYGHVNWTATYRTDSTIVTPYERFVTFANVTKLPDKPPRNYALGKTKQAAWFVSNCAAANGRMQYVQELQKFMQVDIYGTCGKLHCARTDTKSCFELLNKQYKFYMSFENCNCKDYITEKLYWNALYNDVVPVVMGAAPEDYRKVAPPHSYIHVDDFASPRELAAYLHKLDADDALYNDYFRWKGTGHFINTKFWCRVCAMAHAADEQQHAMWYEDVRAWWSGDRVCVKTQPGQRWASWRGVKRRDVGQDVTNVKHVTR